MNEDIRVWVLELLQIRDNKINEISKILSEHNMALKILGAGLVIFFTGLVGFGFTLAITCWQVFGK